MHQRLKCTKFDSGVCPSVRRLEFDTNVPGPVAALPRISLCTDVSARQHLRSATRRLLVVPRCRLNRLGTRAISVAGLSLWNSLRDSLRDPDLGRDGFRKRINLLCTEAFSVLDMFQDDTLFTLTYLLTYLRYFTLPPRFKTFPPE